MVNPAPAISVIVPVYNADRFLCRCVDSILAQDFADFELLLVNDGSTDTSACICNQYASADQRVHVIHKPNGGVASARRVGIEAAKGTFSIHVDADDWIEPNMLSFMYQTISDNQYDIVVADFYMDFKGGKSEYCNQSIIGDDTCSMLKAILMGKRMGTLWNKMIRHTLYKNYNVKVIDGINYCEDVLVLSQLMKHEVKLSHISRAYYHYDQSNPFSITRNYSIETYNMKKKYHQQLSLYLSGTNWERVICHVGHTIKLQALEHGLMTKEEYYTFCPPSFSTAFLYTCHYSLYPFGLLASLGFYDAGVRVWQILKNLLGIIKGRRR